MMLSAVIGIAAIAVPVVVVPIRRELGLPTYQWDADLSHPVSVARGLWGVEVGELYSVGSHPCATIRPCPRSC